MNIYYDVTNSRLVNSTGNPVQTVPQFYYGTVPVIDFQFMDDSGNPIDLSAMTAWRAAIDTEFNASTPPACRTDYTGIDAANAATGMIKVTFDCRTAEFLTKLKNARSQTAWLDLYGINADGASEFIAQMQVQIVAVVDPEQGTPPIVPDLYPSMSTVKAMIREGSGGANITVNGITPDEDGNIELTARWVPMPEKNEYDNDIIVSAVCGSQDLAQFYERMQGAVFNIDGNTVSTQKDYEGYHYTGEVELKYNVEYPDYSWIVQNIEAEYGEGNIDPEKHYYLHTQIHEMLDKYSACSVNDAYAGEYKPGQIWLDAGRIPYARYSNPDDSGETIIDHVENIDYSALFTPDYYYMNEADASGNTGISYATGVTYEAPYNGWLIIEWCSNDLKDESYVMINLEYQFPLGTASESGGTAWRQFIFPMSAGTSFEIYADEVRDFKIRFLPCYNQIQY